MTEIIDHLTRLLQSLEEQNLPSKMEITLEPRAFDWIAEQVIRESGEGIMSAPPVWMVINGAKILRRPEEIAQDEEPNAATPCSER